MGVLCDDYAVLQTEYLSPQTAAMPPRGALAKETARQIRAYLQKPRGFVFDLPLLSAPTLHQRRTRAAMLTIPGGETRTYGQIAAQINSSARAVGGACRANFLPLIVPCHRVVAANGLGGFMGARGGNYWRIKKILLALEAT